MLPSEIAHTDRDKKNKHAGGERMKPKRTKPKHRDKTTSLRRRSRIAMEIQDAKESSDDTDTAIEDETSDGKAAIRSSADASTLKRGITVDDKDHVLEQTTKSFTASSVIEEPQLSATHASDVAKVSNETLGEMVALMKCVKNMLEDIVTDHKRTVEDSKRMVEDSNRMVEDNKRVRSMVKGVFETMRNIERRCPNLENSARHMEKSYRGDQWKFCGVDR